MKIARSIPCNIYIAGNAIKGSKKSLNYIQERFAHKLQCSRDLCSFMVDDTETFKHCLWVQRIRLELHDKCKQRFIISSASEVESLDKAHVPLGDFTLLAVTARSLLQSARASARLVQLDCEGRNKLLATKKKPDKL